MNLKMLAGAAWAALAISAATPATALVRTPVFADYAAAIPQSTSANEDFCNLHWSYRQEMRFLNTGCSQNVCPLPDRTPLVTFVYSPGRKSTSWYSACPGDHHVYALSSCAC